MLQVTIISNNAYFKSGLRNLLAGMTGGNDTGDALPLTFSFQHDPCTVPDIIFRDFMVTINMISRRGYRNAQAWQERGQVIHIPFSCRGLTIEEIAMKVRKIFLVASAGYGAATHTDFYKSAGLKRYSQLSVTENNIMLLTGQGNDTSEISRLLHRSERTIGTHCRNAIKKMGMENRLEFYKYASCLAKYGEGNGITLCM